MKNIMTASYFDDASKKKLISDKIQIAWATKVEPTIKSKKEKTIQALRR